MCRRYKKNLNAIFLFKIQIYHKNNNTWRNLLHTRADVGVSGEMWSDTDFAIYYSLYIEPELSCFGGGGHNLHSNILFPESDSGYYMQGQKHFVKVLRIKFWLKISNSLTLNSLMPSVFRSFCTKTGGYYAAQHYCSFPYVVFWIRAGWYVYTLLRYLFNHSAYHFIIRWKYYRLCLEMSLHHLVNHDKLDMLIESTQGL